MGMSGDDHDRFQISPPFLSRSPDFPSLKSWLDWFGVELGR